MKEGKGRGEGENTAAEVVGMAAARTFSCENFFINLISRRILFPSTGSSNALVIFFIATFSPVSLSSAEITTPYAPCPMGRISEYLDFICRWV
jgi:hypothetical protein